jgi:hypothetical protein
MNKGCLIFAYNADIDYGSQAVLAAKLANKYLGVPVSVVTNQETLDFLNEKFSELPFDQIVLTGTPPEKNQRGLRDGQKSQKVVSFINGNRGNAWELTPYDRTLIIDSDFLVFSNKLNQYWESKHSFLINPGMIDLSDIERDARDYHLNKYSINLLWATNIMFSKNAEAKLFFDMVLHVKNNYSYYAGLYQFPSGQYRNDFSFSIACHILGEYGELPCPVFIRDVDDIHQVDTDQITYVLKDYSKNGNSLLARTKDQDVHIMNKHSILNNFEGLIALAN